MAIRGQRVRSERAALILGVLSAIVSASTARGQANQDLAPLVAQVDPCVVTITLDQSEGSGFVVDPRGVIVTNYHVIEGAKKATVIFADKKSFEVKGYLSIFPNKDLAVLLIDPGDKKLQSLRLADNPPGKGERVFAFGAPMGLSGSVSDGLVAALRPGEDVRAQLQKLTNHDVYK
jgi:S1-C subfamily serine protease